MPLSSLLFFQSDVGPRGVHVPQIRRVRMEDMSPSPTPQGSGVDARPRALSHDDMLYLSGLSAVRRCESPGPGMRIFKRAVPRARPESPASFSAHNASSPNTPSGMSTSFSASGWCTTAHTAAHSSSSSAAQSPTRMLLREIDGICDELDHINVISQNISTIATSEEAYACMEGRKPGDVKYLPGTPIQSPKQRWFYVKPPENATLVKPISFRTVAHEPAVKVTIPSSDPVHWDLPTRGPSAFKSGSA
jgi:hypothetical protein